MSTILEEDDTRWNLASIRKHITWSGEEKYLWILTRFERRRAELLWLDTSAGELVKLAYHQVKRPSITMEKHGLSLVSEELWRRV